MMEQHPDPLRHEPDAAPHAIPGQSAAEPPLLGGDAGRQPGGAAGAPVDPNLPPAPPQDEPPSGPAQDATPPALPEPAAQIAASIQETDDASLDRAVEEAMAGITAEDLVGAAGEPPTAEEPTADTIVTGRIANIGTEDVLIDFGAKALGTMPNAEFSKDEQYAVGDSIEVLVLGEDRRSGLLNVSRRKARQAAVLRDMKVGLIVEAAVTGMNKGGLEVDFHGVRGFIPASQVDLRFMKDISDLIGQVVKAEVTRFELDNEMPNVVLSRRKVLLREEAERKEQLLQELEAGQIRRGRVRSTTDFGAFVDIGGVDGLLHIRDLSWGRVTKTEDVVKAGDEIDVKIIKVNREKKKISLSLKQTITDPWLGVAERYAAGTRLQGRVVRLADFGAFVELEPGVDALLPVSEMSWTRRVHRPSEIVHEGDVVEVSVLTVDAEKRRISLSLKALLEDPWTVAAETFKVGSTIKGKVVRTTDFGAFIQLENGIDGLVHISELDDHHVKAVTDKVKVGQEVDVRVLGVDGEAKRISLSMRKPPPEPTPEEIAKIVAEKAEIARKKASRPKRGGITFGWDEGLGSLDPSKFVR